MARLILLLILFSLLLVGATPFPGGSGGGGGEPPAGPIGATQWNNAGTHGGTGPGNSGEVLTSQGAGLPPTFQPASGGVGTELPVTTGDLAVFSDSSGNLIKSGGQPNSDHAALTNLTTGWNHTQHPRRTEGTLLPMDPSAAARPGCSVPGAEHYYNTDHQTLYVATDCTVDAERWVPVAGNVIQNVAKMGAAGTVTSSSRCIPTLGNSITVTGNNARGGAQYQVALREGQMRVDAMYVQISDITNFEPGDAMTFRVYACPYDLTNSVSANCPPYAMANAAFRIDDTSDQTTQVVMPDEYITVPAASTLLLCSVPTDHENLENDETIELGVEIRYAN